jgi:hypothetical protein
VISRKGKKVWLGIRGACMSQTQGCGRGCCSSIFCLPGREIILLYMRGHLDRQTTERLVAFVCPHENRGMMQCRWLAMGKALSGLIEDR